jgi:hypothetical protein
MATHSHFKKGAQADSSSLGLGKRTALSNASRLGLQLSNQMGEYIVGAHRIGNVLDTKASRGSIATGNLGNVRTASGSAAINLNVSIAWETADALFRKYDNTEGTISHRHQLPTPNKDLSTFGVPIWSWVVEDPITNEQTKRMSTTHIGYAGQAQEEALARREGVRLDLDAAIKRRDDTAQEVPAAEAAQRQRIEEEGAARRRRDDAQAAAAEAAEADPSNTKQLKALAEARYNAQKLLNEAKTALYGASATVASLNATLASLSETITKLETSLVLRDAFFNERADAYSAAKRMSLKEDDARIDELRARDAARGVDENGGAPPL